MNRKMGRIEELLGEGWDVADIASDPRGIAVLLQRGTERRTVVLDQADAAEVLYGAKPESARRAEVLLTR
jgi:hypothetical protein